MLYTTLEGLLPKQLFEEWSPPMRAPEDALSVPSDAVSASTSNPSNEAARMVDGSTTSFWLGQPTINANTVTVSLDKAVHITAVNLHFKYKPTKFTVLVRDAAGAGAETTDPSDDNGWRVQRAVSSFKKDQLRIPINDVVSGVRIRMDGLGTTIHPGTGNKHHGIVSLQLLKSKDAVERPLAGTLADILTLLSGALEATSPGGSAHGVDGSDEVAAVALRGMMAHVQASASLQSALRLVEVALHNIKDDALPASARVACNSFISHMRQAASEEVELGVGVGAVRAGAVEALFDESCKSSGIRLQDGGKKAESTTSSSQYVYATQGFSRGKAAWEFVAERDARGDECVCYGCGVKPVVSGSYNSSQNLWMIRGYNGQIYGPGTGRTVTKLHQDEVIRFELDCDARNVRLLVNGVDKGIVFENLPADKEIFPAICTYSSGRLVRIEKIEGSIGVAASDDSTMCTELEASAITASGLASEVKPGELDTEGTPISIGGVGSPYDVALKPEPDATIEETSVRYELETDESGAEKYESIVGHIAVDDSTSDGAKPSIVEVLGDDDEVLWASPEMRLPGLTNRVFFRVFMKGASAVTFRSRAAVPGSDKVAATVLQAPRLCAPRDWSWVNVGPDSPHGAAPGVAVPTTGLELASALLDIVSTFAAIASRAPLPSTSDVNPLECDEEQDLVPLEAPFAVQVDANTFNVLASTLQQVMPLVTKEGEDGGTNTRMALALLSLLRANLSRLTVSQVDPSNVGINLVAHNGEKPTLAPVHDILSELMKPGAAAPRSVQIAAASALDAGLQLLYPTARERRELLESLIASGGVIEVQFAFPTVQVPTEEEKKRLEKAKEAGESKKQEKQYDLRFDRALLLLQVECEALGWPFYLDGKWGAYTHLVIGIPSTSASGASNSAVDFLDSGFGTIMRKAGFESWTFPSGCDSPKIALKIERHLNFALSERTFTAEESGGFVRIYPRSAGSYEEVCDHVTTFLGKVEVSEDE